MPRLMEVPEAIEGLLAVAHEERRRLGRMAERTTKNQLSRWIHLVENHLAEIKADELSAAGGAYTGDTTIATRSGLLVDLVKPVPHKVVLEDIAHHLSQVNRFTGAPTRPISVAEHSCLVLEIVEGWTDEPEHEEFEDVDVLRFALLHDAPEYVLGDVSGPLKRIIGPIYKKLEKEWEAAILERFNVPAPSPAARVFVKQADVRARYAEGCVLMPQEPTWQDPEQTQLPRGAHPPSGLSWETARTRFALHASRLGLR